VNSKIVLFSGCKKWFLTLREEQGGHFERKALRTVFGAKGRKVAEGGNSFE
jgi:hypothetical protein